MICVWLPLCAEPRSLQASFYRQTWTLFKRDPCLNVAFSFFLSFSLSFLLLFQHVFVLRQVVPILPRLLAETSTECFRSNIEKNERYICILPLCSSFPWSHGLPPSQLLAEHFNQIETSSEGRLNQNPELPNIFIITFHNTIYWS